MKKSICTCICHKKGVTVLHSLACCNFTYQQYINKDGTIDYEIYNKLLKTINKK